MHVTIYFFEFIQCSVNSVVLEVRLNLIIRTATLKISVGKHKDNKIYLVIFDYELYRIPMCLLTHSIFSIKSLGFIHVYS